MGAVSLVLQLIIAIPLGVIAATKQYSRTDYAITAGRWWASRCPPSSSPPY